jgi:hypothetical protein
MSKSLTLNQKRGIMKHYQKPLVNTIFKEGLFFRCQATPPNCNAEISTCNSGFISDISMVDCQFTACIGTGAAAPNEDGSIVFDCGGAQQFTADFITVTPTGLQCTGGIEFSITVDVSPELPDTCNGGLIDYDNGSGGGINCLG